MTSIIKVDTIQDQDGNNIINENADTITIGASGDTISIPSGATLSSTDPLIFPAGTAGDPAITTTGDLNTGIFFPSADTIAFTEGGTEAMRVNSDGNIALAGNIGLGGATPTTSGTGITFPATASASTNANTLDDYEEGTWTPVYTPAGGSITSILNTGYYTKIGRVVHIDGFIATDGVSSPTGVVSITGLPFTSTNSSRFNSSVAIGLAHRFLTDMPNLKGQIEPNQTKIIFFKSNTTVTTEVQLNSTDINTASASNVNILAFSVIYTTAS
jgi:hypothetical protein